MKIRSIFSKGGMRAILSGFFKRWSGEMNLPIKSHNPSRPASKAWIVYIPGTSGVVISHREAKPDEVNDNPLSCE